MTLDEMSAASGLNRGTIHRILDGTTADPGFDSVARLARALRVPLAELDLDSSMTRPEDAPAHGVSPGSHILDRAILAAQSEAGTWRADVLEAVVALTRALGRQEHRDKDSPTTGAARR